MDEESHTNQNSSDLKQLAQALLVSKKPFYERWFNTPIKAQFFSIGLLIALSLIYLLLVTLTNNSQCNNSCEQPDNIYQRAISIDPQTLEFSYLEYELNKELTPDSIEEIKQALAQKFKGQQESLIDSRFVTAKASYKVLENRLSKTLLPEISGAIHIIQTSGRVKDAQYVFPTTLFYQSLNEHQSDIQKQLTDKRYLDGENGIEAFNTMFALVTLQYEREQKYLEDATEYIKSFKSHLSFSWLGKLNWITQLVFWTWFGVLINNIVWLIRSTKHAAGKDDLPFTPATYITLFSRIVIAPFISIIFLAMVSSGMASFDISNLNNLPGFLVAAFFLGFMSEAVTLRIRQFFNKLVDSIAYHKQPVLTLADIKPAPSYVPMKNSSLSNLEANMRGVVKNELNEQTIKNNMIKSSNLDK